MPSKRNLQVAPLRRIAVYVEEPEPGWFAWALIEADGSLEWSQLEAAEQSLRSYKEAMAAGLMALQVLVGDLDVGPREEPPTEAKKPTSTGFGFGFGAKLP